MICILSTIVDDDDANKKPFQYVAGVHAYLK